MEKLLYSPTAPTYMHVYLLFAQLKFYCIPVNNQDNHIIHDMMENAVTNRINSPKGEQVVS